jgi:dihydropteroate synthase
LREFPDARNAIEYGMNWIRKRHLWRICDAELPLGTRTLVVGVLDLTLLPREGGKPDRDKAVEAAQQMEQQGADVIDVTAQGDPPTGTLSSDAELRQLVPVLRRLRHNLGVPVCVTTCHAETAERAIELGAVIVYDFSGLAVDPQLASVIHRTGAGLVLGHTRGTPDTWNKLQPVSNLPEIVARELDSSISRARAAGISSRQMVVDPGLGMGKRGPENYQVLKNLGMIAELGPLQVSPSNKPFLVESVRAPESERLLATVAVAAISAAQGAHLLRVCEVSEVKQTLKAMDRMLELE